MREIYRFALTWSTSGFHFQFTSKQEGVRPLTFGVFIDTDSEGPRGRTGRPDTPSSSANSSSRRSTLSRVHFADDMCNPLASPRSDATVTAVPVPVPSKSTNPTVGLPASVTGSSELPPPSVDKRNAFAQLRGKVAASQSSSRPSHPSLSSPRASSIPPVPPLPVSILKNRPGNISLADLKPRSSSAPPSPPKMVDNSDAPEGNNKPLPVYDPHTPSPRTPSFDKEGVRNPILRTPFSPTLISPPSHRPGLSTMKDLPEAVRTLQYQYEAIQKRLTTQMDDIHKLEKKIEDFFALTENYIKDQMDAQLKRSSNLSSHLSQLKQGTKKTKDEVDEIKDTIHEMRLEINGLTSTVNDLGAKIDMCLTGIWENTEEPFVAYQRRKNQEIDEDMQDIGDLAVNNGAQLMFLRQSMIRMQLAFRLLQHENNLVVSQNVQLALPQFPLVQGNNVPTAGTHQPPATSATGAAPPASTTVPASAPPANSTLSASTAVPAKATSAKSTSSGLTTVPAKVNPAKSTSSTTSTVRAKTTPSTSANAPAKTTPSASVPAKATSPASATGSATITSPGSSTAKPSSIPRRPKKSLSSQMRDKENIGNTIGYTENNMTAEDFTSGRVGPPVPELPHGIVIPGVPGVAIPLANIHPLYRSGFREVNAPGMPAAPAVQTSRAAKPKGPVSPETGKDKTRK
ncbi:uncharacterized protein N7500_001149 [Penicillium coprophilum]|uniref:uncharacterized protein n=1 Tax=Penicillium coprophilum TaxID=36646 RepID=UPI0023A7465B|nr:uncharacterized protein N7500_001149 [Penicillium coprophilum]KAJ5178450.1 hypothetical protein N7500_001149 [Penicillium coprophilum]